MSENDLKFVPIPIAKLQPDLPLKTDIFLRVGGKFIKYKNQGDALSSEKYNFFIAKNLKEIFIELGQVDEFMNWLADLRQQSIDAQVSEVGEEYRSVVECTEDIREKVYETFAELELDSGLVDVLQDEVKKFIKEVQKTSIPTEVMARLAKHSDSLHDHAVNTANFAVFVAMLLGHGNHKTLEQVYMGALFHDYGKAKIPPDVLEDTSGRTYIQAIQDHPQKGAKMLAKIEALDKQVIKIVLQHHEQFNGAGYPKGLKGDEIHGLTKIVTIANVFDNTLVENKNKAKKEKYRTAIKVIEYDKGKIFDPAMMERVVEGLKLAYGDYYKPPSKTEDLSSIKIDTEEDIIAEDIDFSEIDDD